MNKQTLLVVLITFLTILAWVIFDIIHARSQVTISPETESLISPINPNINLSILDK